MKQHLPSQIEIDHKFRMMLGEMEDKLLSLKRSKRKKSLTKEELRERCANYISKTRNLQRIFSRWVGFIPNYKGYDRRFVEHRLNSIGERAYTLRMNARKIRDGKSFKNIWYVN
jgi:hypothetical protein